MSPETFAHIALLEWQLAAAQARDAEWRLRVQRLVDRGARLHEPVEVERYGNRERIEVRARDLASLALHLAEPADDARLRIRLHAARRDLLEQLAEWGLIPAGRTRELLEEIEQTGDAFKGSRSAAGLPTAVGPSTGAQGAYQRP